MSQIGVYFHAIEDGGVTKHVPRSLQIDLESGVCDRVERVFQRDRSF